MALCYLAFGGNLNDVEQTIAQAVALLAEHPAITLMQMSSLYPTAPVGEQAGGTFLNAACEIETSLNPLPLLDLLQQIELKLGRTRQQHWGPRTIDIDIILYNQKCIDQPQLSIPHPACWYRRFVLDPLVEIAASVMHPVKQVTILQLQQRLLKRPLAVALAGGDTVYKERLSTSLSLQFPELIFSDWNSTAELSDREPTLLVWLGQGDGNQTEQKNLPTLPLLDLSQANDKETALRDVLHSAGG